MNIYFLVEGRRTEKKVYPKWLSHLIPDLQEVNCATDCKGNNFYVFSGNGYPSLLDNHLRNSIGDVNDIGNFDYLVVCLDADESTVDDRRDEVYNFVKKNQLTLVKTELIVIVQNRCIESWFLGNRRVYSKNPQSERLRTFNQFYNVQINDPELMKKHNDFTTHAQFHEAYLSEMLSERNIKYSKKNPNAVVESQYLNELVLRQKELNQITTFGDFIRFCDAIKDKISYII